MSDFLKWDPEEYTVWVGSMDREHETLIAIMNRLHARRAAGAERAELARIAGELAAFTVKHFRDEEAYMESIGFAGLASHRIIHKDLLQKFTQHMQAFEASGAFTEDFFKFLRHWLTAHIRGIDRKYGSQGRLSASA